MSVCNELSHCTSEDFIKTLRDNTDKLPTNLTIIATNAGILGSWQHRWQQLYRDDPRWYFQKVTEVAPWIPADFIADAERRNSASRFYRLWRGIWSTGGGDALDPADIAACVTLDGPMSGYQPGYLFAAALDLGIKHDHSALVVVGLRPGDRRCKLASCQSWRPGTDGRIDLTVVEKAVLDVHQRFRPIEVRFDPWQAMLMA